MWNDGESGEGDVIMMGRQEWGREKDEEND